MPLSATAPKVHGPVLINSAYKPNDRGRVVKRRYTYFPAGRTAFVVQCTSPPDSWAAVLNDFDALLLTLVPGNGTTIRDHTGDPALFETLRDRLPTLLGSWPTEWRCSGTVIGVAKQGAAGDRSLEIKLAFRREDIKRIYEATELMFWAMKQRKSQDGELPDRLKNASASNADFMKFVGQVWGYVYGEASANEPLIESFSVIIADATGTRVGAVSVSKEDASAILAGKVSGEDHAGVASRYAFE